MRLLGYFYFSLFDSHDFSALEPRNPDYMAVFDPIYSLCFVVALPVAELVVWTDNIVDWALWWGAIYFYWDGPFGWTQRFNHALEVSDVRYEDRATRNSDGDAKRSTQGVLVFKDGKEM